MFIHEGCSILILIFLGWGRGRIVDVVNVVFSVIFFHEICEWGRGEEGGVGAGPIKVGAGVRWGLE